VTRFIGVKWLIVVDLGVKQITGFAGVMGPFKFKGKHRVKFRVPLS